MLMAILLTLAMVFTMMPAMVWADVSTEAEEPAYYLKADTLGVGSYVITAGDYMALKAPASGDTIRDAEKVTPETVDGKLVVKSPDASLVWNSEAFASSDASGYKLKNSDGSLFFTSGTQTGDYGLKYQDGGYRPINLDANSKMYATSEKTGNPKHYLVYDDAKGSYAGTGKDFHTLADSDGTEASVVTLFRLSYAVDFNMMGHGAAIERKYSSYDAGEGESIVMPADPSETNWVFRGWFTDEKCTKAWSGSAGARAKVTGNVVLFAKWTVDETALAQAKDAANAELDKVDLSKYDKAEQETMLAYITVARDAIKNADTVEAVNDAMTRFNADVANVPTSADKKKAEDDAAKVQATKVQIKKPSVGKKKVTVKWVANAAVFEGYQVQYKVKTAKKWKSKNAASATASKKVIKKLKKGKKYKVRVRGYKTINGVKVYGPWSKTKTTKKVK
jgi:uncharacterized repeat protein (TIGR02543 family)